MSGGGQTLPAFLVSLYITRCRTGAEALPSDTAGLGCKAVGR